MINYMVALLARTLFGYKIQNSYFVKYYSVNVSCYHCVIIKCVNTFWDRCMDLNMCSTMCL